MNANRMSPAFLAATLFATLLGVANTADAGLFRAYLSQSGNDANPCTVTSPCRLLPAALAAVNDGGEIWMVDSANYNTAPVSITKSVTILAIPGAIGSIVANGGDAIDIAAANVRVTLRNLVMLEFNAGVHGINFSNGTRLIVEECEINGIPQDAIHVTAASSGVVVKNTSIHNIGGAGVFLTNTTAGLDHVTFVSNNLGVVAASSTSVTLNESLINNTNAGVTATESGGSGTRVTIINSVIRASTTGISVSSPTVADKVRVTVSRTTLSHNPTGLDVEAPSGDAAVTLDGNIVQNDATAININGGVVFTLGNNVLNFSTNGVVGGSLTTLGGV